VRATCVTHSIVASELTGPVADNPPGSLTSHPASSTNSTCRISTLFWTPWRDSAARRWNPHGVRLQIRPSDHFQSVTGRIDEIDTAPTVFGVGLARELPMRVGGVLNPTHGTSQPIPECEPC